MIKKKDQSYEWALEQMNKWFGGIKLQDISKKLWTQELLEAAIKHGNATIKGIPYDKLTKEMCVDCMRIHGGTYIFEVPEKYISFDLLLNQISMDPRSFESIFNFHRQGRWNDPCTEEDILLIREALCPRIWGEKLIAERRTDPRTADEVVFADEFEKMDYIAKASRGNFDAAARYCIPHEVLWNSFKHIYMAEQKAKNDADDNAEFALPDGSYFQAVSSSGEVGAHESDTRQWTAMDVHLIRPDGRDILLCSADYEKRKGLRILIHDEEHEEPVYEHLAFSAEDFEKTANEMQ